ncbi:MAG: flagellar biosynthesis protein FliQ [Lachnospiraceae bacterium]|nr:flagellar biosynthesis protein FliQ [Lachnospiraceae bacterium]
MSTADVIDIAAQAIWLILKCSAPMLLSSLVIGLTISIFQTVTSIQEQTLTFVPKLVVILVVLIICGDWILTNIVGFMEDLFSRFGDYVR